MKLDSDLFPVATANTKNSATYEVVVTDKITYDLAQVWESVCGNFFNEADYWVEGFKFLNTTEGFSKWEADGWTPDYKVIVAFEEVNDKTRATLTAEDFANAYTALINEGWAHCGGCTIDDPDACVVDAVLQQAIFGEQVFG